MYHEQKGKSSNIVVPKFLSPAESTKQLIDQVYRCLYLVFPTLLTFSSLETDACRRGTNISHTPTINSNIFNPKFNGNPTSPTRTSSTQRQRYATDLSELFAWCMSRPKMSAITRPRALCPSTGSYTNTGIRRLVSVASFRLNVSKAHSFIQQRSAPSKNPN